MTDNQAEPSETCRGPARWRRTPTVVAAAVVAALAAVSCGASADTATVAADQQIADAVQVHTAVLGDGWRKLPAGGGIDLPGDGCGGVAEFLEDTGRDTARSVAMFNRGGDELPMLRSTVAVRGDIEDVQAMFEPLSEGLAGPAACFAEFLLANAAADPDLSQFEMGVSTAPGPYSGLADQTWSARVELTAASLPDEPAIFDYVFVRVGRAVIIIEAGDIARPVDNIDAAITHIVNQLQRRATIGSETAPQT